MVFLRVVVLLFLIMVVVVVLVVTIIVQWVHVVSHLVVCLFMMHWLLVHDVLIMGLVGWVVVLVVRMALVMRLVVLMFIILMVHSPFVVVRSLFMVVVLFMLIIVRVVILEMLVPRDFNVLVMLINVVRPVRLIQVVVLLS